jgi:hypothetical protein
MDPIVKLLEVRLKRQRQAILETEEQLKSALEVKAANSKQTDLDPKGLGAKR